MASIFLATVQAYSAGPPTWAILRPAHMPTTTVNAWCLSHVPALVAGQTVLVADFGSTLYIIGRQ